MKPVTIDTDDLRLLMDYAGKDVPADDAEHEVNKVLARCGHVLDCSEEGSGTAPEPELPPGSYARVELPGYRQHTGWVTEETRFGVQCAVVRDWSGVVEAEVVIGPGSRVVYLPTPLRRPEEARAAIAVAVESGDPWESASAVEMDAAEPVCICEGHEYDPRCPRHGEPF